MPDHYRLAVRQRLLEEEYFYRREHELLTQKHQRATLEQLSADTGIQDRALLQMLSDLGYTSTTVWLLPLVPLVQVAWQEGGVTFEECGLILQIAHERGIHPGSSAYQVLQDWLTFRPSPEFFNGSLQALRGWLAALPTEQQPVTAPQLVAQCTQIAETSGGFFGFGRISSDERQTLTQIASTLLPPSVPA